MIKVINTMFRTEMQARMPALKNLDWMTFLPRYSGIIAQEIPGVAGDPVK